MYANNALKGGLPTILPNFLAQNQKKFKIDGSTPKTVSNDVNLHTPLWMELVWELQ